MSTKPGATNLPGAVDRVERVGALAALVHAGDDRADDPDVGGAQLAAADVDHGAAGEQQVERLASLRGRDRARPHRGFDGIDAHVASFTASVRICIRRGRDEVAEDAAQLDRHPVGFHVHLGGEVEREPAVDGIAPAARGPRR